MTYSSTATAILAALSVSGVFAKPTAHRHFHRHADKDSYGLDADGWKHLLDWTKIDYSGKGGAPHTDDSYAPAPSSSSPPAGEDKGYNNDDHAVSTNSFDLGDVIDGLVGLSNKLTSFGKPTSSSGAMGDFYMGNVGNPYGSNVIKVDSEDGYDYTVNYKNTSPSPMTICIWNKAGSDGQPLSGGASVSKECTLTFTLASQANQVVAFQSDSQVGFAQATKDKTFSGHFATSFGECNMTPNGPACNLSAILNPKGNTYKMKITNKENDCVSSNEENCWVTEKQTLPGLDGKDRNGSCYIPGAAGHFTVEMGGQQ
ncbi:hypothetical protein EJ05DRAFT_498304 [Pseudovirgaria hyperparasitica]|uniref:Allergen Asp f 4 n=1 Tax=Pseudovirgaria hyperparasitica TaxID=470096 RepID=A0A6A6WEN4_9PEZI|nr:uncharacterized protein EJ05DRAFT_498304 [Pseudovirgaria hyperparasitica]KAF2760346.1 hypothetical protein EJ05DRAFT_498304 [Pseudovirgaria hyperparasitica]